MDKLKNLWNVIKNFALSVPERMDKMSKATLLSFVVGVIITLIFGIPGFIRSFAVVAGIVGGWALDNYAVLNIKRNPTIVGAIVAQVFLWLF